MTARGVGAAAALVAQRNGLAGETGVAVHQAVVVVGALVGAANGRPMVGARRHAPALAVDALTAGAAHQPIAHVCPSTERATRFMHSISSCHRKGNDRVQFPLSSWEETLFTLTVHSWSIISNRCNQINPSYTARHF